MKIHFLIASLASGGAEHQLSIISNCLQEGGNDISLVTFADVEDHYILNPKIHRIRIAKDKTKLLKLFALWMFLLKVETQNIVIFTQRNCFLALPPLFFRKGINVICGERNLTFSSPSIYEKFLCNLFYRRANKIVCNSYSQQKYLISKYPWLKDKCTTIINYTDTNKYTPSSTCYPTTRRIGIFARIDKQKNCINFAKAVKIAYEKSPLPFVVEWYGSNHNGNKLTLEYDILKKYIQENGLTKIFFLMGPVKSPDEYMKDLDIICLPSIFEGFSNSIAEGICSGKPMVVSNVSDNCIMVSNEENGYLFNPNDINDIAEKLILIINDSNEKLKRMGIASRNIAEHLFCKNQFIESYKSLLV